MPAARLGKNGFLEYETCKFLVTAAAGWAAPFHFDLGTCFSVVVLAGASMLYTTLSIMPDYTDNANLAAAIQLFAAAALMFWHLLRLFMGTCR